MAVNWKIERAQLEGMADLKQALEAIGTEVATKVGVVANRDAAKALQDALVTSAPQGPGKDKYRRLKSGGVTQSNYGHLRENIRVGRRKSNKQGKIVHHVTTGRAFWGFFLEYGTAHMPPHPWFRPVVEAVRPYLVNVQIQGLRTGIEKEAVKASKKARRFGKVLPNGRNA